MYEVPYEVVRSWLEDQDEVLPSSNIESQDEVHTLSQQRIIRDEVLSSSEAKFWLRHIFTEYLLWTDEVLFVTSTLDNWILVNLRITRTYEPHG